MPVTVRPAIASDSPALARLEMGHASPAVEREWRERIQAQGGDFAQTMHVLVGEDPEGAPGTVVGYLRFGPVATERHPQPRSMEVLGLYVLPAHRRRGLATALVREASRQADAAGVQRLLARCIASNVPARRFYDALAATVVDRGMYADVGLVFEEVLYGWGDLQQLSAAAERLR